MEKRFFLNSIDYEDKNALSNLYDKIQLAEKISKTVYTNEFYPPSVWKSITSMSRSLGISVYTNGIFEDSDRRMIAFTAEEADSYPITLMKIENKSRFHELQHRDYLGAIMSLGVKREKFGDMILKDNSCYAAVCEDISDYIRDNLDYIGKCPCIVELLQEFDVQNLSAKYERIVVFSTSMRLDCVVSALTNVSRAGAVDLIHGGKILLDYAEVSEKDRIVQEDSVITIRGFGKFKVEEQVGATQKGRLKLSIKKYM
jgi:RNA-binding protein YlmH